MATQKLISSPEHISLTAAVKVWARIGLLSFGGPAGQIALMHRELVEKARWVSESRFLHALNYCMLLPGPEAQQLAIYIGWLMHRTVGGVVAGVLFVLPGALVILLLSALYVHFQQVPIVAALFFGIKSAVLAIVVEAVRRIGKRALKDPVSVLVAALAFIALFAFAVPFPSIILAAAIIGVLKHLLKPTLRPAEEVAQSDDSLVDRLFADGRLEHTKPTARRFFLTLIVCCALWFVPIAVLMAVLGRQHIFVEQSLFFSQAALVTFGGAYSVLTYVAQRAVEDFEWLRAGEMIDGLSLAETTPGPLILVLQFVAFVGASRGTTGLPPDVAGLIGSAVMLWTTFVPCFLWIFLGAPYIEKLRSLQILNAALGAVTAAVVGVILNLSLWFALHTLFAEQWTIDWRGLQATVPVFSTLNIASAALTVGALIALLRFRIGIPVLLSACAALGLVMKFAF